MTFSGIEQHIVGIVAASSLASGFIIAEIRHRLGAVEQKITLDIANEIKKLDRPKDKIALKAVLDAIEDRYPDGGAAKFSLAIDDFIKTHPLAAPYRTVLIEGFIGIEKALQAGVDQGTA